MEEYEIGKIHIVIQVEVRGTTRLAKGGAGTTYAPQKLQVVGQVRIIVVIRVTRQHKLERPHVDDGLVTRAVATVGRGGIVEAARIADMILGNVFGYARVVAGVDARRAGPKAQVFRPVVSGERGQYELRVAVEVPVARPAAFDATERGQRVAGAVSTEMLGPTTRHDAVGQGRVAGLAVAHGDGILEERTVCDRSEGVIRAADRLSVSNEDAVGHGRDGADEPQRRPIPFEPAGVQRG